MEAQIETMIRLVDQALTISDQITDERYNTSKDEVVTSLTNALINLNNQYKLITPQVGEPVI